MYDTIKYTLNDCKIILKTLKFNCVFVINFISNEKHQKFYKKSF